MAKDRLKPLAKNDLLAQHYRIERHLFGDGYINFYLAYDQEKDWPIAVEEFCIDYFNEPEERAANGNKIKQNGQFLSSIKFFSSHYLKMFQELLSIKDIKLITGKDRLGPDSYLKEAERLLSELGYAVQFQYLTTRRHYYLARLIKDSEFEAYLLDKSRTGKPDEQAVVDHFLDLFSMLGNLAEARDVRESLEGFNNSINARNDYLAKCREKPPAPMVAPAKPTPPPIDISLWIKSEPLLADPARDKHRILEPPVPLLLGRYQIEKRIGGGGMGNVYLAYDQADNNRLVALKETLCYSDLDAEQPTVLPEAILRGQQATQLQHPGLPKLRDFFILQNGFRFIQISDFIDGETLETKLRKYKWDQDEPCPEYQVVEWAIAICEIFEYLHSQSPSIIYSSRTENLPASIMIESNSQGLLLLGLPEYVAPIYRVKYSGIGFIGYSSPETFYGKFDHRSDLYCLGALMFHLVTGTNPTDNPLLIFDFDKNPRPAQRNTELSPALDKIICKAVEAKPANRYQSAREMRAALEEHRLVLASSTTKKPTFKLKIINSNSEKSVTFSSKKAEILIGRNVSYVTTGPIIDLTEFDISGKVSRRHAMIYFDGRNYFIKDLGSSNGSKLNGEMLVVNHPYQLTPGDQIVIGDIVLQFLIAG